MACKQYHSDQGVDALIPEPGESATGTRDIAARVWATSSRDVPARHSTVLQLTAAGMRIVGLGHHADRATYRLVYAVDELSECGRVLHIA